MQDKELSVFRLNMCAMWGRENIFPLWHYECVCEWANGSIEQGKRGLLMLIFGFFFLLGNLVIK